MDAVFMNSVNSEESDPHITQVINILLYQTLLLYQKYYHIKTAASRLFAFSPK